MTFRFFLTSAPIFAKMELPLQKNQRDRKGIIMTEFEKARAEYNGQDTVARAKGREADAIRMAREAEGCIYGMTEDQVIRLAEMDEQGMADADIAAILQVSAESVVTWKRRIDAEKPPEPVSRHRPNRIKIDQQKFRAMVEAGATSKELAKAFGVSVPSVVLYKQKFGLVRKKVG